MYAVAVPREVKISVLMGMHSLCFYMAVYLSDEIERVQKSRSEPLSYRAGEHYNTLN